MTALSPASALAYIIHNILREFVSLPSQTWLPLMRKLRSHLAYAHLDEAAPEDMPFIAGALLDDLIHDAGILDVHRYRIVEHVEQELTCLIQGSYDKEADDDE